ncbi:histidine--tRNA ligase [Labedella endophytica]|uniref:Histidine--tRNA ligase n=1 Tax=Labedella endophytica TaxID=1523160 RepID=A0A3S0XLJ3_9MICO|nr:histidine--tRNA ligase [Labedella endophytica]RUQ99178.1 histidine--tRNA ligase [Labedella endophytica]
MASPISPPRGMRDFLPAEKARRESALATIRRVYRAHGFDEIETPVVEDHQRLHSGLGGDNEKLAYSVLKRGLDADALRSAADGDGASSLADLGLRFDLTVPLARFYASHRAELPPVFRSLQVAPVWRAERPQKGRYRQFVQCDIDIIGEPGPLAEIELLSATSTALRALGIDGFRIRINDRRLLVGMLDGFGFPADEHAGVLITIDKLDKIGPVGVVAELRDRGVTTAGVDALEEFLQRPQTQEFVPFGEKQIRRALPDGADDTVIGELVTIGRAATAQSRIDVQPPGDPQFARDLVVFDPFLVRGMGYYTGPIFEIEHPDFGYSLGGGGRYDGMIGRFLGQDVPATGFSIGFERIVDIVETREDAATASVVLLHESDADPAVLLRLKAELIRNGAARVRLERRTKNVKALLERVAADGFGRFASVPRDAAGDVTSADLAFRPLV